MIFDSNVLLISLILIGGFISEKINLHPAENCLRKCVSTDIHSNYLPPKLPKN